MAFLSDGMPLSLIEKHFESYELFFHTSEILLRNAVLKRYSKLLARWVLFLADYLRQNSLQIAHRRLDSERQEAY